MPWRIFLPKIGLIWSNLKDPYCFSFEIWWFLGAQKSPMFYIGIPAEGEKYPRAIDHNFWTAKPNLKYDSSLKRRKKVLKHTRKAKQNSKTPLYPPPLALTKAKL